MKTLPSTPKPFTDCIVCIRWCIYCVILLRQLPGRETPPPCYCGEKPNFWPVQPPLPKVTGKAEPVWAARPVALKLSRQLGHMDTSRRSSSFSGTQTQRLPSVPWTARMFGKWAPAAHPPGGPRAGGPRSGYGLAPLGGSGTENQRGSPRKPSRRARGPQPTPPWLAPCSHPHLAVVLRVQGIPGLAEKGGVLGHVGKAGDDLIKVPGGAEQRGRAEGLLPQEVVSQTRTLPLSQPPHCEHIQVCAELLWFLTRSEALVMGSSPKRRMNLCGLRW